VGQGSEFWFTARFGRRVDAAPPAGLSGVRALIIDDNATNREILMTRLSAWGMRPEEAHDGPSGLQALYRALGEKDPFRLAVVDMQMPGMDGESVGRAVKADARIADTRLVMLTSLGIRGDAKRLQEIGFVGYAAKPVRYEELKGVLSQALNSGADSAPRPIATCRTAREALPDFAHRKARILLAEDNITNQQVALGILKKLGLSADEENGIQGSEGHQLSPVVFDRAGMLERLMGDEELAETIAQGFLADIPRQIEALRNYLEAGDAAGAERQAHTIKGASANVGGERLRALAFEMEKAGKAGDLESIKTRMDELAATFAELKQTMKGDTPCVS
jgi:CheY-like chemotaxis protein